MGNYNTVPIQILSRTACLRLSIHPEQRKLKNQQFPSLLQQEQEVARLQAVYNRPTKPISELLSTCALTKSFTDQK
jgi:hypothetical protein